MASVRCGEVDRFKACLDEHHWLGHRVGGLVQTAAVPPPALRREQPAFLSGLRAVSGPIWPFCGARTDAAALSGDYQASYRYPVLVVETFTDPARHRAAATHRRLGQTLGYGRSPGAYVHHGNPKLAWAQGPRRDAVEILSAAFDHPLLSPSSARRAVIDLHPPTLPITLLHRRSSIASGRAGEGNAAGWLGHIIMSVVTDGCDVVPLLWRY